MGLASDQVPKRLPFQQLHGDEGLAFELIYLVNRADVGVVERRRGLGFAPEALQGLMSLAISSGRNFKGDKAMRARVSSAL